MTSGSRFEERFQEQLRVLGLTEPDTHVLVALSGGCDSVTLLYLLRFRAGSDLRLTAAHLDHGMRPSSAGDARWVAGLCRAWQVPLVSQRSTTPLRSEDEARRARVAFLRETAESAGATCTATGHHADDQAETVLFRALRGTGLEGLTGIAPRTATGRVRPLLPFWRQEIERYARQAGLRWREDPTNRSLDPVRNRIRHRLLPRLEREVAPGARRNLVRLAERAREAEEGWSAVLSPLFQAAVREEDGAFLLAREKLQEYHPAIASRLLRTLLRRLGVVLDRLGTHRALQFITDSPSGRELQLPNGVRIRTEFTVARVEQAREILADREARISAGEARGGFSRSVRVGSRRYRVVGGVEAVSGLEGAADTGSPGWRVALRYEALRFPLAVRGWTPGDRIRLSGGTKTLKKLFGERKVPRSTRDRLPLLVDGQGAVLWVAGVAFDPALTPQVGDEALILSVADD